MVGSCHISPHSRVSHQSKPILGLATGFGEAWGRSHLESPSVPHLPGPQGMSGMTSRYREISRLLRLPFHVLDAHRRVRKLNARAHRLEEIVDLSLDLGSKGLLKVTARQIRSEILGLARAVEQIKPRTILEIGTARGGTLLIWAHLASARVITCDLEQSPLRRRLYRRFPRPGGPEIVPLAGDSHAPQFRMRVEAVLQGDPVDFLFIDGDHTLDGVRADYESYRNLVRPGGLIAFHDIVPKQPFAETRVHDFWIELRRRTITEELVQNWDQVGFGIGLVRVKE